MFKIVFYNEGQPSDFIEFQCSIAELKEIVKFYKSRYKYVTVFKKGYEELKLSWM